MLRQLKSVTIFVFSNSLWPFEYTSSSVREVIIMQLAMTSLSSIWKGHTEPRVRGPPARGDQQSPNTDVLQRREGCPLSCYSPPSLCCQILCHRTRFVTLHDKIQIRFAWHFGSWWYTTIPTLNKIWTHRQTWWFQQTNKIYSSILNQLSHNKQTQKALYRSILTFWTKAHTWLQVSHAGL